MLVVPLIFVSLVCGTSSLKDISTLGRLGGKNVAFYLMTTAITITITITFAIIMGNIFEPGVGIDLSSATSYASS
jgi:Na+/H+-dicarboxylate symporter